MTIRESVEAIAAMVLPDVVRRYDHPPMVINEVPCSFPRSPRVRMERESFGGSGLQRTSLELVVLVGPMLQGQNDGNWWKAIDIADGVRAGLAANMNAFGLDGWTVEVQADGPESEYWAVVAQLEMSR